MHYTWLCRLFKNYQQDCVSFPLFRKPAFRLRYLIQNHGFMCIFCIHMVIHVVTNVNQTNLRFISSAAAAVVA